MKREYICAYGDCEETETSISINYRNDERPRFCCESHAALWLMRRQWREQPERLRELEHELHRVM